jgi:hypothetical protein
MHALFQKEDSKMKSSARALVTPHPVEETFAISKKEEDEMKSYAKARGYLSSFEDTFGATFFAPNAYEHDSIKEDMQRMNELFAQDGEDLDRKLFAVAPNPSEVSIKEDMQRMNELFAQDGEDLDRKLFAVAPNPSEVSIKEDMQRMNELFAQDLNFFPFAMAPMQSLVLQKDTPAINENIAMEELSRHVVEDAVADLTIEEDRTTKDPLFKKNKYIQAYISILSSWERRIKGTSLGGSWNPVAYYKDEYYGISLNISQSVRRAIVDTLNKFMEQGSTLDQAASRLDSIRESLNPPTFTNLRWHLLRLPAFPTEGGSEKATKRRRVDSSNFVLSEITEETTVNKIILEWNVSIGDGRPSIESLDNMHGGSWIHDEETRAGYLTRSTVMKVLRKWARVYEEEGRGTDVAMARSIEDLEEMRRGLCPPTITSLALELELEE